MIVIWSCIVLFYHLFDTVVINNYYYVDLFFQEECFYQVTYSFVIVPTELRLYFLQVLLYSNRVKGKLALAIGLGL